MGLAKGRTASLGPAVAAHDRASAMARTGRRRREPVVTSYVGLDALSSATSRSRANLAEAEGARRAFLARSPTDQTEVLGGPAPTGGGVAEQSVTWLRLQHLRCGVPSVAGQLPPVNEASQELEIIRRHTPLVSGGGQRLHLAHRPPRLERREVSDSRPSTASRRRRRLGLTYTWVVVMDR
jgi:hypothetical protein